MDKNKLERANKLDKLIATAEKIKDVKISSTSTLGECISHLIKSDYTFEHEFDKLIGATVERFREEFDNM